MFSHKRVLILLSSSFLQSKQYFHLILLFVSILISIPNYFLPLFLMPRGQCYCQIAISKPALCFTLYNVFSTFSLKRAQILLDYILQALVSFEGYLLALIAVKGHLDKRCSHGELWELWYIHRWRAPYIHDSLCFGQAQPSTSQPAFITKGILPGNTEWTHSFPSGHHSEFFLEIQRVNPLVSIWTSLLSSL